MARKLKQVLTLSGTDRRNTGYYSTPEPVANYIFRRLREINPYGKHVIDPCVGKEELAKPFLNFGFSVTGIDILDHGGVRRSTFIQKDFIQLYEQTRSGDLFSINSCDLTVYDYWIANPPYNCHEVEYIKSNKEHLKNLFSDVGVHNMYSMFISAMLDMAKEGAILGFVTLDSFLTSKAHTELRNKILTNCIIHDILLCPTDLFSDQGADVRTCIFIIQKGKSNTNPYVKLLNRTLNKKNFFHNLENRNFCELPLEEILLNGDVDNQEFLIGVPNEIKALFNYERIGQKYNCVTGISTGNDSKYISSDPKAGFTVPFYKNPGSRKFHCEPDGYLIDHFLTENKKITNFMVRNIPLLFKSGITCSSMGVEFSACYLPPNATFGVNSTIICDDKDIWWLLAYLNSNIAKYIVRGVLIRTNMITSGYVSRLPVPNLSTLHKDELSSLSKLAYSSAKSNSSDMLSIVNEINKKLYEILKVLPDTQNEINDFCKNIVKKS